MCTYKSSCSSNYTLRMDANHMGTHTDRQTDRVTLDTHTHVQTYTQNKNTACIGNRHANNMRSTTKTHKNMPVKWMCVYTSIHKYKTWKPVSSGRPAFWSSALSFTKRSNHQIKIASALRKQTPSKTTHHSSENKTRAYSAPVFSSFVSMGSRTCAQLCVTLFVPCHQFGISCVHFLDTFCEITQSTYAAASVHVQIQNLGQFHMIICTIIMQNILYILSDAPRIIKANINKMY